MNSLSSMSIVLFDLNEELLRMREDLVNSYVVSGDIRWENKKNFLDLQDRIQNVMQKRFSDKDLDSKDLVNELQANLIWLYLLLNCVETVDR